MDIDMDIDRNLQFFVDNLLTHVQSIDAQQKLALALPFSATFMASHRTWCRNCLQSRLYHRRHRRRHQRQRQQRQQRQQSNDQPTTNPLGLRKRSKPTRRRGTDCCRALRDGFISLPRSSSSPESARIICYALTLLAAASAMRCLGRCASRRRPEGQQPNKQTNKQRETLLQSLSSTASIEEEERSSSKRDAFRSNRRSLFRLPRVLRVLRLHSLRQQLCLHVSGLSRESADRLHELSRAAESLSGRAGRVRGFHSFVRGAATFYATLAVT